MIFYNYCIYFNHQITPELFTYFCIKVTTKIKSILYEYNITHNSIDINQYTNYIFRIDYNQSKSRIQTTTNSQQRLYTLAINNPSEYTRLVPNGKI